MKQVFNKLNGILLGGLLAGILITGLGSGIAFAEYMGFEYDGSALAEGSAHETEEFSYELASGERVYAPANQLILDESLPEGTVFVEVEYDPYTMSIAHGVGQDYDATRIEITAVNVRSEFERFMQNKDFLLQGLREGKIVAIPGDYFFDVKVAINPADKNRVFINHEELRRATEAEANERAADPVR